MTRNTTPRARLLAHRLFEFVDKVRADGGGFAGLMADQTALRALAVALVFTVVVFTHVRFVVERGGRLGLLTGFLLRFGRIEFGVDDLAVEPEHGHRRTHSLRFALQIMTTH